MIPSEVFDDVRAADGEFLGLAAYQAEFEEVYRDASEVVWKLERAQHFHEAGRAELAGRRRGRLGEGRRAHRGDAGPADRDVPRAGPVPAAACRRAAPHSLPAVGGADLRRTGGGGRGDQSDRSGGGRPLETRAPLPELVVFGPSLLYEVRYDEIGAAVGARRITDTAVVAPCLSALASLYGEGEDLMPFFEREVAPLPPPLDLSEKSAEIGP